VNIRAFPSKSSRNRPPIGEFQCRKLAKPPRIPASLKGLPSVETGTQVFLVVDMSAKLDPSHSLPSHDLVGGRGNRILRFREVRGACHGFTLIEIMVVVVIIGIALSITVSNLFVSTEERVRQEAERTLALVEKTRDQAVFSGYPIAVRLTPSGIEFLERDPNSVEPTWRAAATETLRTRRWRDGIRVELTTGIGGNTPPRTDSAGSREQVVTFLPTGVGAPFSLRVFSDEHQRFIDGDALGNVSFRR